MNGSIVKGIREPILISLGLDKPPVHKRKEQPRIKLFEEIKKICFVSDNI